MLSEFLKNATAELVKSNNKNLDRLKSELEERHSARIAQLTDIISSEKIRFANEIKLIEQAKDNFSADLSNESCDNADATKEQNEQKLLDTSSFYDLSELNEEITRKINKATTELEERLVKTIKETSYSSSENIDDINVTQ